MRAIILAAALSLAACDADAQPRPEALPAEFATLYDCRGEAVLIAYYWDRLPRRPGGGKPDPAVLQPLMQAYQAGNIPECHRQVIAVRRYLGLLP